jgi:hypothetical protein
MGGNTSCFSTPRDHGEQDFYDSPEPTLDTFLAHIKVATARSLASPQDLLHIQSHATTAAYTTKCDSAAVRSALEKLSVVAVSSLEHVAESDLAHAG